MIKNGLPFRQNRFPIFLLLGVMVLITCDYKKKAPAHEPRIPYPDAAEAKFLQEKVDSMQFLWFKDIKSTASSFCNEELRIAGGVSTGEVTILSEGLFHAKVEVQLPERILILTLDRPFKNRGRDSIWQIVKMEDKNGK